MKKTKTVSAALCAAALLLLLSACGGAKVRDDVPVSGLSSAVDSAIGNEGDLVAAPESYLSSLMELDFSSLPEYVVKINSRGVNIDEYGIFKAAEGQKVSDLEATVKGYLQNRIDIWMPEYMPEELPKLENAEVKTVGNYVMYMILSDSQKAAAGATFESSLAE